MRRRRKGIFGSRVCLVLFLLVFFNGHRAVASTWIDRVESIFQNNAGVDKLVREQDAGAASQLFAEALAGRPFSAEIHYNLATSFLVSREYDKAIQEYATAARRTDDPELLFHIHFNAAVAATEKKDYDQALAHYQSALGYRPDSKEVKTNIELLTSRSGGEGEGGESSDKNEKGDKSKEQEGQDGNGNPKDDKKENDGQGSQDKKENTGQNIQNPRSTPRPFKSEELSPQDVKRIEEELRRQEEGVRAKFQEGKPKNAPNAKDW